MTSKLCDIVSAAHVDDKPVVPVGGKPIDSGEMTNIATCSTLPVCVNKSVQTGDVCDDRGLVHMEE